MTECHEVVARASAGGGVARVRLFAFERDDVMTDGHPRSFTREAALPPPDLGSARHSHAAMPAHRGYQAGRYPPNGTPGLVERLEGHPRNHRQGWEPASGLLTNAADTVVAIYG
jgi:hypothetical protein